MTRLKARVTFSLHQKGNATSNQCMSHGNSGPSFCPVKEVQLMGERRGPYSGKLPKSLWVNKQGHSLLRSQASCLEEDIKRAMGESESSRTTYHRSIYYPPQCHNTRLHFRNPHVLFTKTQNLTTSCSPAGIVQG